MQIDGKVSIWIGRFDSNEKLNKYVDQVYDDNENVRSAFMDDFIIPYYDHDFQEAYCDEKTGRVSVNTLLDPLSYSKSIIPQLLKINIENCNTIICLYNFVYDGRIKQNSGMNFIGVFDYDKKSE